MGEQEVVVLPFLPRRTTMVTTYWLIACLVLVCTMQLPLASAASGSTNNWAVLVCSVSSTSSSLVSTGPNSPASSRDSGSTTGSVSYLPAREAPANDVLAAHGQHSRHVRSRVAPAALH